jgi:phage head maturation protease
MPTPNEGESREDFVKRCIPIVIDDGTAKDQDQAVAICNSMFDKKSLAKGLRSAILEDEELVEVIEIDNATALLIAGLLDPEEQEAETKAVTKKEKDGEHPSSHYLVVEDSEKPTTWHLRVKDADGSVSHRLMGAAWAALTNPRGYRGNRYQGPNRQQALAKLRRLYKSEGLDTPDKEKSFKGYAMAVKSMTDEKVVVNGYGVIWGNPEDRDLENEYFTKDTDFWFDKLIPGNNQRPVLYEHGEHPVIGKQVFGYTSAWETDDIGLWVESELDRHNKYIDVVLALADRGALAYSSAAVGHLIEKNKGQIKSWPIAEWTLTVEPAEPRLLDIRELRSLRDVLPLEIEDEEPEGVDSVGHVIPVKF